MEIFDYEDILLLPRKCKILSRAECNTSLKLGEHQFKIPIVPSNMKTVINQDIAKWLSRNGYFYIMHRFDVDTKRFALEMNKENLIVSISLGVKQTDYELVEDLFRLGINIDYITIDIAHGHAESVRRMIEFIKIKMPETFVIAGNIGTQEAVIDLENWGADATKVGIGPGKACITKLKTGFGTGGWQLSALGMCTKVATKPVIADGGIRNHGDIAKSIRFGASMVMVGSLFAGLEESPGELVVRSNGRFKEYYGSASDFNKGNHRHVEGIRILEPVKGTLSDFLREVEEDLQSSISYSGGRDLIDIRNVDYILLNGDNSIIQ